MRGGALDPARRDYAFEVIERNAQAQNRLVADLLDISRMISGKIRINPSQVDVGTLVELVIEGMLPAADAKRIRLGGVSSARLRELPAVGQQRHSSSWRARDRAVDRQARRRAARWRHPRRERGRGAGGDLLRSLADQPAHLDDARRIQGARDPHVIISDIGMPEQDGYALIRSIRTLADVAKRNIPAIAITAFARNEDRTAALVEGFNQHLAKPVEPSALIAAVHDLALHSRR